MDYSVHMYEESFLLDTIGLLSIKDNVQFSWNTHKSSIPKLFLILEEAGLGGCLFMSHIHCMSPPPQCDTMSHIQTIHIKLQKTSVHLIPQHRPYNQYLCVCGHNGHNMESFLEEL